MYHGLHCLARDAHQTRRPRYLARVASYMHGKWKQNVETARMAVARMSEIKYHRLRQWYQRNPVGKWMVNVDKNRFNQIYVSIELKPIDQYLSKQRDHKGDAVEPQW